jgi:hypothetical protein
LSFDRNADARRHVCHRENCHAERWDVFWKPDFPRLGSWSQQNRIGLLSVTIASFMAMATIIGLQLLRTVQIDPNERIAGSRMVYYLVATAITYVSSLPFRCLRGNADNIQALVLPFFVQLFYMMMDSELTSSRVAEFALFASGTVIAVIHIFLRANAARLAIKPRETPWQARRRFRLFGPSELEIMNISPPLNLINPNYGSDEKIADLYARQQRPALKVQSPQTPLPNFSFPAKSFDNGSKSPWPLPQQRLPSPKEARGPSSLPRMGADHNRRQPSYTLWPGADDIKLPLAVYSPPGPSNAPLPLRSVLQLDTGGTLTSQKYQPPSASTKANSSPGSPPAPGRLVPPALPWAPSHRRGSSASSSATVQIGIRFSTAPSALGAANRRSSLQIPPLAPRKDSIKFDPALLNSKALPPLVGHASPLSTPQPVTDVTGRDLDAFTWADSPNDDIERQSNSSEPLFELVTRAINRRSSLAETMKSVYSQSSVVGLPDRKGWI